VNIADLASEIFGCFGRLEQKLETLIQRLEKDLGKLDPQKGDAPKTFQVQARKVDAPVPVTPPGAQTGSFVTTPSSTGEPIGGKWKLDSIVTPDMNQGAKPEGKFNG
jgi:hypothetical protein